MKKRTVPYGYTITNGRAQPIPSETRVLQKIFHSYLAGESLRSIGESLNRQGIEYTAGMTGWNQSRLARILTDTRYLGDSTYPQIVDTDIFGSAAETLQSRNTQRETDRSHAIYHLSVPVLCPVCGWPMTRKHYPTCKITEKWVCNHADCKTQVFLSDDDLLSRVAAILEHLRQEPDRLDSQKDAQMSSTPAIRKLETEIEALEHSYPLDVDKLTKLYVSLAAQRFQSIGDEPFKTEKMRAVFASAGPLSSISIDCMNRAVEHIWLFPDGTVELVLMNGQRFREEDFHGGTDLAKTGLENANATKAGGYGTEPVSPETGSGLLPGVH